MSALSSALEVQVDLKGGTATIDFFEDGECRLWGGTVWGVAADERQRLVGEGQNVPPSTSSSPRRLSLDEPDELGVVGTDAIVLEAKVFEVLAELAAARGNESSFVTPEYEIERGFDLLGGFVEALGQGDFLVGGLFGRDRELLGGAHAVENGLERLILTLSRASKGTAVVNERKEARVLEVFLHTDLNGDRAPLDGYTNRSPYTSGSSLRPESRFTSCDGLY